MKRKNPRKNTDSRSSPPEHPMGANTTEISPSEQFQLRIKIQDSSRRSPDDVASHLVIFTRAKKTFNRERPLEKLTLPRSFSVPWKLNQGRHRGPHTVFRPSKITWTVTGRCRAWLFNFHAYRVEVHRVWFVLGRVSFQRFASSKRPSRWTVNRQSRRHAIFTEHF